MTDLPPSLTPPPAGYTDWLAELKARIHSAQQRAALAVDRELVLLYWQIGRDILDRQAREGWGAKVIERLAHDLRTAFPDMKGFSRATLLSMRAFAQAWPEPGILQQLVGQMPWGHKLVLLAMLKTPERRLAYAERAVQHGWSRSVLKMQIETRRIERAGQAVTNFAQRLPAPGSDLAQQSLHDPYGLLLCKSKNKVVAEYALVDNTQPMGIAGYKLMESLPADLQTGRPSIEQIERELGALPDGAPEESS